MTIPQMTAQQTAQVSRYIIAQHDEFLWRCTPLSPEQRAAMNGFFSPHLLDGVRASNLDGLQVANPAFYPLLAGMGFAYLPDFSQMAAITFYLSLIHI